MNETTTVAPQCSHWRIVDVHALGHSVYEVELVLGDDERYASALLRIGNRAARGTHEPADWLVRVEVCRDASAHEWLGAAEHEYAIGNRCVMGYAP